MAGEGLDSEYENGVADVLAFISGPNATVRRNVMLPGHRSNIDRQIDVLVTSRDPIMGETNIVVDCKNWNKPLDIAHIQAFHGLLEDVGADSGILITTKGASTAAHTYANKARAYRIYTLSLAELSAWSPPGTVHFDIEVPATEAGLLSRKLRRAGYRVRPSTTEPRSGDDAVITVFRHFGTDSPSVESQTDMREQIREVLENNTNGEISFRGNGIVMGGGTPGHLWLEVTYQGQSMGGLKIVASNEHEITRQLDLIASLDPSIARHDLDVLRPDPWPIPHLFPRWDQP